MDDLEAIYLRWVDELWNKGNLDILEELYAENGLAHYPYFLVGDEPIRGRENFKRFFELAWTNFSDIHSEVKEITSEGDRVTALTEISGVRVSEESENEIVKERISIDGLCRIVFENGKIVEIWNNMQISVEDNKTQLFEFENI